jgi:hypothetical protein
MLSFDGVAREVCTARRIRTNTPLQALVSLNDEAYLDMARKLSYKVQSYYSNNPQQQIKKAYEQITGHVIKEKTFLSLMKLYQAAMQKFDGNKENACEVAGGKSNNYRTAATAALVVVTNAILNLDEVVTKN